MARKIFTSYTGEHDNLMGLLRYYLASLQMAEIEENCWDGVEVTKVELHRDRAVVYLSNGQKYGYNFER